jgi:hypothetical protein
MKHSAKMRFREYKIPAPTLSVSSADCNCLIEAIEAANSMVEAGYTVYVQSGYQSEDIDQQRQYAATVKEIADKLQQFIEHEQPAVINFEP